MALTVAGAIGRASLAWLVFYWFLAHAFVYWNWNATNGEPGTNSKSVDLDPQRQRQGQQQQAILEKKEQDDILDEQELAALLAETPLERVSLIELNEDPIPDEIPPVEDQRQELNQQVDRLQKELDTLQDEIKYWTEQEQALEKANQELKLALETALQKHQNYSSSTNAAATNNATSPLWQTVEQKLAFWEKEMPTWSQGTQNATMASELARQLQETTDLSTFQTVEELDAWMDALVQGLDEHVRESELIAWQEITHVLRASGNYPKQISGTLPRTACQAAPDAVVEAADSDDDNDNDEEILFLAPDDVREYLDELRVMYEDTYQDSALPLISPRGQARMSTIKDKLVDEWQNKAEQNIRESLRQQQEQGSSGSHNGLCVRLEQAESILRAGLVALERKQDLNQAILSELSKQGVDTRNLIMDAVLEEDESQEARHLALLWEDDSNRGIQWTWRQVLDRPWTKTVTHSWLPRLVDAIGGYIDPLDHWLDQHLPAGSQDGGQVALEHLLETAGKYPLPGPIVQWLKSNQLRKRQQQ